MITVYGSDQCPKTVKILALCREMGYEVDYKNISVDLKNLWKFVLIRDKESVFDIVKANGRLGIPCVICGNGHIFDGGEEPFDHEAVMKTIAANNQGKTC